MAPISFRRFGLCEGEICWIDALQLTTVTFEIQIEVFFFIGYRSLTRNGWILLLDEAS